MSGDNNKLLKASDDELRLLIAERFMEIEHICANVTEEIRDLKDISEDTVTCVRELTMSLKPLVAQDKEYKDLRQKALARIITGSAWTVFAAIAFLVFLGIKHYFGLDA